MSTAEDFTDEQKQYLQGFLSGADAGRIARGMQPFAPAAQANSAAVATPAPAGPEAVHFEAQNRVLQAGRKLSAEEETKRQKHPLDVWDDMRAHTAENRFPKGPDVFRFKYHGLFYVAPTQDSFMCRLRLPAGIVQSFQLREIARLADEFAGGYAHVTTRANLQLREIQANNALSILMGLQNVGVVTRGSGADNIRNITAAPTAGVDVQEIIDARPLAFEQHHYILQHREMYGLPRKFNIAFDGGGRTGVLEDTNDIGFAAVRVPEGKAAPAGVYFRLQFGGITGHKDFARDQGVLVRPDQCIAVSAATIRVFIREGDRTDRRRARLKYVLDRLGHESFLAEVEKLLPEKLARLSLADCEPRGPLDRHGHIGWHRQRQIGKWYVGVIAPVGRLETDQLRGLAGIADQFGSGVVRLTVWQNLLISDVAEKDIAAVEQELTRLGLNWSANSMWAGLVACTGNQGCKFSAADTKGHALRVAERVDGLLVLDQPLNVHLTGCHNSCAQHYIGDIGFMGAKVEVGEEEVEGYKVFLGGGFGADQQIGRALFDDAVNAEEIPSLVEKLIRFYQEQRLTPAETFHEFTNRHSAEEIRQMLQTAPAEANA